MNIQYSVTASRYLCYNERMIQPDKAFDEIPALVCDIREYQHSILDARKIYDSSLSCYGITTVPESRIEGWKIKWILTRVR